MISFHSRGISSLIKTEEMCLVSSVFFCSSCYFNQFCCNLKSIWCLVPFKFVNNHFNLEGIKVRRIGVQVYVFQSA